MTLEELQAAYAWFRGRHGGLPSMEMVQVSIAPPIKIAASPLDPTQGSERLSTEIANFAPVEGWLCYQSAVIEVRDGAVPKPGDGRGLILSGELINAAWESLHIRQNGRGGWLLTRFTPDRGETYLADEHRFVVHAPTQGYTSAPRYLRYRRFWTLGKDQRNTRQGIRQHAACFIGFMEGN
jgi:hypothetical protein